MEFNYMKKNEELVENSEDSNKKLHLSDVSICKNYVVITPDGKEITVEEYMETDDYNSKLEQQINDFMTNKKQKELIELFKK